jgi:hypothetical protein
VAKVTLVLISCVLAASCASHAPMTQPVAAPVVAQPVVAQAAPMPPADAPKPAMATAPPATAAAPGASSVVPNKDLVNRGFHLTQVKGQPMYCRSQTITGSNLKTTVCKTEAQILFEQLQAQDLTNQLQGESCTDPGGNNHMTACLH